MIANMASMNGKWQDTDKLFPWNAKTYVAALKREVASEDELEAKMMAWADRQNERVKQTSG